MHNIEEIMSILSSYGVSTEIINKQSIIGIEKSFMWAKLRTIATGDSFSDNSEKLLVRSMDFSTVLYLVRNKEHHISQGYIPSRFQKTNKKTTKQ